MTLETFERFLPIGRQAPDESQNYSVCGGFHGAVRPVCSELDLEVESMVTRQSKIQGLERLTFSGSITISLLAPSELGPPGVGRVRIALLIATSLIVPPLRTREVVLA